MDEFERSQKFLENQMPGASEASRKLREQIIRLNLTEMSNRRRFIQPVLIEGETGVGKEFAAKILCAHWIWLNWTKQRQDSFLAGAPEAIQQLKADVRKEFYAFSVTDLLEDLGLAELVGCTKGAFTGADKPRTGILGSNRTHILVDEMPDASLQLQGQLLRIVQHRRRRPVGGEVEDEVDIHARLIFAGNRPLIDEVQKGTFREDLYHRLQGSHLEIPSLARTPERIPELLKALTDELLNEKIIPASVTFALAPEDLDWAVHNSWPGNIRQLRRSLESWIDSIILDKRQSQLKDRLAGAEQRVRSAPRDPDAVVLDLVKSELDGSSEPFENFGGFMSRFRLLIARGLAQAYDKELVPRSAFERSFQNPKSVIDQARKYLRGQADES